VFKKLANFICAQFNVRFKASVTAAIFNNNNNNNNNNNKRVSVHPDIPDLFFVPSMCATNRSHNLPNQTSHIFGEPTEQLLETKQQYVNGT
jgi:hypothetical protein